MDVIRIGKTDEPGYPVIVVEVLGVPIASSTHQVAEYDADPEGFVKKWRQRFAEEIVSVLADKFQKDGRMRGWLMATRLSPRPPSLPTEGEEE